MSLKSPKCVVCNKSVRRQVIPSVKTFEKRKPIYLHGSHVENCFGPFHSSKCLKTYCNSMNLTVRFSKLTGYTVM